MKSKKVLKNGKRCYLYLSKIVVDAYFLAILDQLGFKMFPGEHAP